MTPSCVHRLPAGIDVLGDAQRADEAALLVDHGDAGIGGALLVQRPQVETPSSSIVPLSG